MQCSAGMHVAAPAPENLSLLTFAFCLDALLVYVVWVGWCCSCCLFRIASPSTVTIDGLDYYDAGDVAPNGDALQCVA